MSIVKTAAFVVGVRGIYLPGEQTGLLVWLVRVLEQLPNGAVLVTASWFAKRSPSSSWGFAATAPPCALPAQR